MLCFVGLAIRQKYFPMSGTKLYPAQIGATKIEVEVARDIFEQSRGLSYREDLPTNHAMIFVYPDYDVRIFHMKNMNFPLDIIWLKDGLVVGYVENLQPLTDNQVSRVNSVEPVNAVLEVNAGFINKNNIQIGTEFQQLTD